MNDTSVPNIILGPVNGVYKWPMPVFNDLRGKLFKAYVAEPEGSFPVTFHTHEHFFTESKKDVFRGMHFQMEPHAVAKVISLVRGNAIIFILDARGGSPTYGFLQRESFSVNAPLSIYIPIGVALGYLILQDETTISYRMNGGFCGNCDAGINPDVLSDYIPLPLAQTIRSERDLQLQPFSNPNFFSLCSKVKGS
jgi:dTDP-4-dehydrorhamnose 3,5-epimerase-like enzyme